MPRPKLPRSIHAPPPSSHGFIPRGKHRGETVTLSVEEYEAIRLVDFEGHDQTRAAEKMGISRQTFGRVLRSGRFSLSKALVKGQPLEVSGGCYEIRGHGRGRGQGKTGRRNRRQGENFDPIMMQHQQTTGGHMMTEQNNTSGKNRPSETPGSGQGRGQGQGTGMGKGRGLGGGRGDGSCRRKDGGRGRGRGMGGGRGNGSSRS